MSTPGAEGRSALVDWRRLGVARSRRRRRALLPPAAAAAAAADAKGTEFLPCAYCKCYFSHAAATCRGDQRYFSTTKKGALVGSVLLERRAAVANASMATRLLRFSLGFLHMHRMWS